MIKEKWRILSAATLSLFISAGSINNGIVVWQADQQLQWSNFKGRADTSSYESTFEAAVICTSLDLNAYFDESSVKPFVKIGVDAIMLEDSSWYLPHLVNSNSLHHEQIHFNITEYNARLFRKSLDSLSAIGYSYSEIVTSQLLNEIWDRANSQHLAMQDEFDDYTIYGNSYDRQIKYSEDLLEKLNKLSQYESYKATFPVK